MDDSDSKSLALRIERGHADEEELAALTVVLLALSGGAAQERSGKPAAGTSRWWRDAAVYSAPRSWQ